MADIFLSYAREDAAKAGELARALGELGWSVFWDRRIPAGSSWDDIVEQELRASKCVVVLWSTASVKSQWVKTEASFGLKLGTLVPAAIDPIEPPIAFYFVETAQLHDWTAGTSHPEFVVLTDGIARHVPPAAHIAISGTADVATPRDSERLPPRPIEGATPPSQSARDETDARASGAPIRRVHKPSSDFAPELSPKKGWHTGRLVPLASAAVVLLAVVTYSVSQYTRSASSAPDSVGASDGAKQEPAAKPSPPTPAATPNESPAQVTKSPTSQGATGPFEPTVGQPGKDVVWVPTPQALVEEMLDLAKVTPQDYVVDLGSGDGRTVIAAARRGARALGIEYNPDMVDLAKRNAAAAGVSARATFTKADLFESDFSKATVVTMFLLPSINLRLRPTILNMKPGTRIVSNTFTMEEWQPDDSVTVGGDCTSWCTAHLWIVPAKIAGTWQLGQSLLTLKQEFQMMSGTLGTSPISGGKLRGDEISFAVGGARYAGRVNGREMSGTIAGGRGGTWTATRK